MLEYLEAREVCRQGIKTLSTEFMADNYDQFLYAKMKGGDKKSKVLKFWTGYTRHNLTHFADKGVFVELKGYQSHFDPVVTAQLIVEKNPFGRAMAGRAAEVLLLKG